MLQFLRFRSSPTTSTVLQVTDTVIPNGGKKRLLEGFTVLMTLSRRETKTFTQKKRMVEKTLDTPVTIQLYLVRHGETIANTQQIVIGQSDSALTHIGINQTKSLSYDPRLECHTFWRIYSSDLKRTQHTTAILLQLDTQHKNLNNNNNDDDNDQIESFVEYPENEIVQSIYSPILHREGVRLEKRIREIAKGSRQGFVKTLTIDEAKKERIRQGISNISPLLESENDTWIRMSSWMNEIIRDAIQESRTTPACKKDGPCKVLAVSHSASIRTFLTRLLGEKMIQSHSDAQFDDMDRLIIPNTSLTILDLHVAPHKNWNNETNAEAIFVASNDILQNQANGFTMSIDIVELTSTSHYMT